MPAKRRKSIRQSRLHRAKRKLEDCRHIGERHVLLEMQHQDSATGWRDSGAVHQLLNLDTRRSGFSGDEVIEQILVGMMDATPAFLSQMIECRARRNPIRPGADQAGLSEPFEMFRNGD
jgi:hypothetical protein